MAKKQECVKDYAYFVGKQNDLGDEMIREIIRKLEKSDEANDMFGLNVNYDFKESDKNNIYYWRFLESYNFGRYRLDSIKKINGTWIFGLFSVSEECVECYAINGNDEVTTDIFNIDTLFQIIALLEEYEKRGGGVIKGKDEWEK